MAIDTEDAIMTEYTIVASAMRDPDVQHDAIMYKYFEMEERRLRLLLHDPNHKEDNQECQVS